MYTLLASTISSMQAPQVAQSNITTDQLISWYEPTLLSGSTWQNKGYVEGYNTSVNEFASLTNGSVESTDSNGIKACYLDGVNDRVWASIGSYKTWPTIRAQNSGASFEVWVRSNGNWLSNGNIWSAYGNGGIRCRTSSSGTFNYPYIAGGGAHSVGTLATNTWYHIVTTIAPTTRTVKTYFNGVLVKTNSSGWNPSSWIGGTFMIGGYQSTGESQRMYISTIRLYEKALSDAEVLTHYDEEKAYHGY